MQAYTGCRCKCLTATFWGAGRLPVTQRRSPSPIPAPSCCRHSAVPAGPSSPLTAPPQRTLPRTKNQHICPKMGRSRKRPRDNGAVTMLPHFCHRLSEGKQKAFSFLEKRGACRTRRVATEHAAHQHALGLQLERRQRSLEDERKTCIYPLPHSISSPEKDHCQAGGRGGHGATHSARSPSMEHAQAWPRLFAGSWWSHEPW